VFKRDQAFASELAKARIAAYHRAFAAVSSLDYAGHGVMHVAALVVAPGSQEEMERAKKLEAKSAVYLDEITKTTSQLAAERYLLGDSFCKAVGHYIERLAADVERFVRSGQPEKEERARMKVERDRIREAVALYLPRSQEPRQRICTSATPMRTAPTRLSPAATCEPRRSSRRCSSARSEQEGADACTPRGLRGHSTGRAHSSGGPLSGPPRPLRSSPRLQPASHFSYAFK